MPTDEPDLAVRKAEAAEASAIADLYTHARVAAVPMMPPALHTNDEDRGWFAAQLAKPSHEAWVAERSGDLVGYALFDSVWLDHLFIRPDMTGHGVGAVLLDLVKSLRPRGFSLWVFESNSGARRFYARHGLIELERTDGSGNEEKAPDVRMVWPGNDPDEFFRDQLQQVDTQVGDLLARRVALTRATLRLWTAEPSEAASADLAVRTMADRAPELGHERIARIADAIITESQGAVGRT